MYIISKFNDYYDGVMNTYGVDKSIVYNRRTKILNQEDIPDEFVKESIWEISGKRKKPNNIVFNRLLESRLYTDINDKCINAKIFIIGFCGKLYVGWKCNYIVDEDYRFSNKVNTDIIYGYDNIIPFLKMNYYFNRLGDDITYILKYDAIDIFRKINAPIFVYDNDEFTVNPKLNDYAFYRIFDTYSTYQELSMFYGGVLTNIEKNIIEIEDKYKIEQYGFDKWSFRKESKRKLKKKMVVSN